MIKFFGLLSNKKKIKIESAISIYVAALNNVIENGFVEIQDFINNNNNLESNPNIQENMITWFSNVIFLGNLKNLENYFEESEVVNLRKNILEEIYKDLDENEQHLAIERFVGYENYFNDIRKKGDAIINTMAYAIFEKYNINDYQGDLFKRKNKPNPINCAIGGLRVFSSVIVFDSVDVVFSAFSTLYLHESYTISICFQPMNLFFLNFIRVTRSNRMKRVIKSQFTISIDNVPEFFSIGVFLK